MVEIFFNFVFLDQFHSLFALLSNVSHIISRKLELDDRMTGSLDIYPGVLIWKINVAYYYVNFCFCRLQEMDKAMSGRGAEPVYRDKIKGLEKSCFLLLLDI